MSRRNDGGPAFPTTQPLEFWGDPNQGMTLRDYFAAKAMQAALPAIIAGATADSETDARLARASYMIADAMLAERERIDTTS